MAKNKTSQKLPIEKDLEEPRQRHKKKLLRFLLGSQRQLQPCQGTLTVDCRVNILFMLLNLCCFLLLQPSPLWCCIGQNGDRKELPKSKQMTESESTEQGFKIKGSAMYDVDRSHGSLTTRFEERKTSTHRFELSSLFIVAL